MKIYSVTDAAFRPYGKILEGYDTAPLCAAMRSIPMPEQGTAYEPSIPVLEECALYGALQNNAYGGMPIQLGLCWGYNTRLNCLEYHRDSEFNLGTEEFILLLASLLVVIPLLVVIFGSLKSQAEAMRFDLALPSELHLENFVKVAQKGNVPLAFKNSMIVTAAVVLVVTLCTSLSSFVIARRNDRFSSFLSGYYSLGLIVPWAIVPTVLLLKILHIQNTQLGLIAVLIALNIPWGSFIITNFINTIPRELDEAAAIDGCGPLTLFFRVVLPLLKPVVATNTIIVGMGAFNELQAPLYLLSSSALTTLPLTVYNFKGRYFSEWNLIFADLLLVALPMVILYVICQKYIVSGVTAGAVKQ